MDFLLSFISLFMCTFGFGAILFSTNKMQLRIPNLIFLLSSMWLTYIVVISFYLLNLLDYIFYVNIILFIAWTASISRFSVHSFNIKNLISKTVLVVASVILVVFEYQPTFYDWDAVISWNRWAVEIARGNYSSHTAYPIGIPTLWSYVYLSQDNDSVYYIAKFIMPIVEIVVLISAVERLINIRRLSSAPFVLFTLIFILTYGHDIESGYADAPLALFVFIFLYLLLDYLKEEKKFNIERELLLFFLASFCAVIKQPGIVILALYISFQLRAIIFNNEKRYFRIIFIFISLAPLALFLILFKYQEHPAQIFGNLNYLMSLSSSSNKLQIIQVLNGFKTFASLSGNMQTFFLTILSLGFIIFYWRQLRTEIVLILTVFTFGFVSYIYCCSYDGRNAMWLMGVLYALATLGLEKLIDHVKVKFS